MKRKLFIIICSWLMVLCTMLMIFNFSEEDSTESSKTSSHIIEDVLGVFMPEEEITEEVIDKYQFSFRKTAHFGIFMLLGFCLANAFKNTISLKLVFTYLISFASVALYATFDEIHQGLSDGRAPSFIDALIDASGGLAGIGLFALMIFVFNTKLLKKIRH